MRHLRGRNAACELAVSGSIHCRLQAKGAATMTIPATTEAEAYAFACAVAAGIAVAIVCGGMLLSWLEGLAYERDKRNDPS